MVYTLNLYSHDEVEVEAKEIMMMTKMTVKMMTHESRVRRNAFS